MLMFKNYSKGRVLPKNVVSQLDAVLTFDLALVIGPPAEWHSWWWCGLCSDICLRVVVEVTGGGVTSVTSH